MQSKVLFFSRDYQSKLFPLLISKKYESLHVVLTTREKKFIQKLGGTVVGCLEEDLFNCKEIDIEFPYLETNLASDRFLSEFDYELRIKLIKKISNFWREILDTYTPIAVVNEPIAIELSEILSIECISKNIRYLAIASFYTPDKFYFLPDPSSSSSFEKVINNLYPEGGKEIAESVFMKIKNKIHPSYALIKNSRYSIFRFFLLLKKLAIELSKRYYARNILIRKLCYCDTSHFVINDIKTYFRIFFISNKYYTDIDEIKSKKFLFFALHFEPEAVITYGSYWNSQQDYFINNLLKSMREDQILVVKEHPQQLGVLTESRFRRLKKMWPNLFFVKGELSSFYLMDNSEAILTLGGTIGLEGLILGKNVINFGKTYYDSYPGVLNYKDFDSLRSFFRNHNEYPKNNDFLNYMSRVYSVLHKGDPLPSENLYSNENIQNIINAIEKELNL